MMAVTCITKVRSYPAAIGLCLLPIFSQAGVICEWQALNDELPWGITLELEFDHRAVASGEFDFDHVDPATDTTVPTRGLLALRCTFPGMSEEMVYDAKNGGFSTGIAYLSVAIRIGANGFMTGSMYLNDGAHHIDLASDGQLFTVIDANSDAQMEGAGCNWEMASCGGATGHIRRYATRPTFPSRERLRCWGRD